VEIGQLPWKSANFRENPPDCQESREERSASIEPFCLLPSAFYK